MHGCLYAYQHILVTGPSSRGSRCLLEVKGKLKVKLKVKLIVKKSKVPEHFSHRAFVRRLAVAVDLAEGL